MDMIIMICGAMKKTLGLGSLVDIVHLGELGWLKVRSKDNWAFCLQKVIENLKYFLKLYHLLFFSEFFYLLLIQT